MDQATHTRLLRMLRDGSIRTYDDSQRLVWLGQAVEEIRRLRGALVQIQEGAQANAGRCLDCATIEGIARETLGELGR